MHLTPELGTFANLLALDTYLAHVESGEVDLLSAEQRIILVESLVSSAIIFADSKEGSKKRNLTTRYRKRIREFFEQKRNFMRVWNILEIETAKQDGRLSPERIVKDMLGDLEVSYAEQSLLESCTCRALLSAEAKYRPAPRAVRAVPKIVSSARISLRRNGQYQRVLDDHARKAS